MVTGGRWLICGGRDFRDTALMWIILSNLVTRRGRPEVVIHGDARGADRLGGAWAGRFKIPVKAVPADWEKHPRAAGPIRNQKMLVEEKPTLVIAFPGGRGTADMVERALNAGIEVIEVK